MTEKITELILHHKLACEELTELINELYGLKGKEGIEQEIDASIERYSSEKAWRKVFISQLEDLI